MSLHLSSWERVLPSLYPHYFIQFCPQPLSCLTPKFSRHTDVFYPDHTTSLPSFQCTLSTFLSHFEEYWDVTSLPTLASDWHNCSRYRSFRYSMASNRAVTKIVATSIAVFSMHGVPNSITCFLLPHRAALLYKLWLPFHLASSYRFSFNISSEWKIRLVPKISRTKLGSH